MKKIVHLTLVGLFLAVAVQGAYAGGSAAVTAPGDAQADKAPRQAAPVKQLVELDESTMDAVAAGGQFASTAGNADAAQGSAFSRSSARSFSNGHVTITSARTVSVAHGSAPSTGSAAAAGSF